MSKKKASAFKTLNEVRKNRESTNEEEIQKKLDQWISGNPGDERKQEKAPSGQDGEAAKQKGKEAEYIRLNFDIPKELHKKIKKRCLLQDMSMKDKILQMLEAEFVE